MEVVLSEVLLITAEEVSALIPKIDMVKVISKSMGLPIKSVMHTQELLENGATIPFIARYRKDVTGGLDEVQIGHIDATITSIEEFEARRLYILNVIADQNKLTQSMLDLFLASDSKTEIEDLYLPYKRKRVTRAAKARAKGLEPLADFFLGNSDLSGQISHIASQFINAEKAVNTLDDAISGASDIVAEIISENSELREKLRKFYKQSSFLVSTVIKSKIEEGIRYKDYYDYSEKSDKIPPHRVLAVSRGENSEILRVHITVINEDAFNIIKSFYSPPKDDLVQIWNNIIADCFKRLLNPAMESEIRRNLKQKADIESISVFSLNLKELLMAAPLGAKTVLALDPGFRSGCKLVILSPQGDYKYYKTIFPHEPRKHWELSKKIIKDLIEKYDVEAVAIGSGTAGRETEKLLVEMKKEGRFEKSIHIVRVDESGASIYSASPIAREEFPDLDLTVRGSISIGRRLQDPLGELVKIDPKSMGIGQYQHDVDQTLLKNSLDQVVLSCVNSVGVELNTSSENLLKYVSGVGPKLAKSIISFREKNGPFKAIKDLLKVPRLGPKAFEQCAGFLRIYGAINPLDYSAVHPESYHIVEKMAQNLSLSLKNLIGSKEIISSIDLKNYITETIGEYSLKDIINELQKPGRDPRNKFESISFREDISEFEDLEIGMILTGVVTNVTGFGAFVDIGVHQDGLIHVSELSHTFVKEPISVVKPGQKVKVKILALDEKRERISLSIKACLPVPESRHKPQSKNRNSSKVKAKEIKPKQFNSNPFQKFFDK
jgi:protein Tex